MVSRVHFPTLACVVLCLSAVLGLGHDQLREKRSLTTICVEIKPSAPQEEPYYMCKGADFAPFRRQQQFEGSQAQHQLPGPYSGSDFQSPIKTKAEQGPKFPTEFQQQQQPSFPAVDFSQPQQQQPQQFFQPAQAARPHEPLHGYESIYNEEKPPAPPYARPPSDTTAQPHSRSYETQPTHSGHYGNPAFAGNQPSVPPYAPSQQQYERPYGWEPFVGATAGPGYAQPSAVPAVPPAPPTAQTTAAPQHAARYAKPPQAAAFAPPTAQTAAGSRNLNGRRLPEQRELPGTRSGPERYRARIDEDVLRVPNWGFSPEEFNLVPSLPVREPTNPVFMPRDMPAEYMDDPVMRQFYASLHEPLLGEAPRQIEQPQIHPARRPESRLAPSYDYTAPATVPYNEPYNVPPTYRPPPQYATHGAISAPTASAATQQRGGEPCLLPTTTPWSSCNSCGYTNYAPPQPVIIAMPCIGGPPNYGQPIQAQPNLPGVPAATQVDYDSLAAANPMLAMGNFGLFNPFHSPLGNPFMMPRGPFGGFGLLGAPNTGMFSMPIPPSLQGYPAEVPKEANSKEARLAEAASPTPRPSTTQTDSNESGSSEEQTEKPTVAKFHKNKTDAKKKNETTTSSSLASTDTIVGSTLPQPISVKTTQAGEATTESIEVPPSLGEESKKTFVTMMSAAKTLSKMSEDDADFAADAPQSRFVKRQHQKAGSAPSKRQYVHKL